MIEKEYSDYKGCRENERKRCVDYVATVTPKNIKINQPPQGQPPPMEDKIHQGGMPGDEVSRD